MTRFATVLPIVAAIVAGAVTTLAGAASGVRGPMHGRFFETPSRNIVCELDEHAAVGAFKGRRTLFCVVLSASGRRGQRTWLMTTTGRPRVSWIVGNIATDVPVLAYGRSWSYQGFSCEARRAGLTCRNESGHGYFLSRKTQRLF